MVDLDELAQNTEGRLLVVHVRVVVKKEGLTNLIVDKIEVIASLVVLVVVSGIYHFDALVDALRGHRPHVRPLVFQSVENQFEVFVSVKKLVEGDHRQLSAKFLDHEDCAVFLNVR